MAGEIPIVDVIVVEEKEREKDEVDDVKMVGSDFIQFASRIRSCQLCFNVVSVERGRDSMLVEMVGLGTE